MGPGLWTVKWRGGQGYPSRFLASGSHNYQSLGKLILELFTLIWKSIYLVWAVVMLRSDSRLITRVSSFQFIFPSAKYVLRDFTITLPNRCPLVIAENTKQTQGLSCPCGFCSPSTTLCGSRDDHLSDLIYETSSHSPSRWDTRTPRPNLYCVDFPYSALF